MNFEKRKIAGLDLLEVPGDPEGASILLFHGYGADAYDLLPLSGMYRAPLRPTFYFPTGPLEVPIAPGYVGRGWFPIDIDRLKQALQERDFSQIERSFPKAAFEELRSLCQQIVVELNLPLSKLFLGGFSQGALLATDMALNLHEKVRGLIVLSGILVQAQEWQKLATLKAGLHFFQSHGLNDSLLPYTQAEALATLFKKAKLQGELHSFAGGHEIPTSILLKLHSFITK